MHRKFARWLVTGCALVAAACAANDDGSPSAAPVGGSGGTPAPIAGASGAAGTMGTAGENAAGMGGTGGAAGAAGEPALPDAGVDAGSPMPPEPCPPAPDGVSEGARLALEAVNAARLPAGAGCATMIPEINTAAQNHCDYYAANTGSCIADAHSEVESCTGFTGTSPGRRMEAAGYTGRGSSEVMAFANDPERAVAMWINSVWHRIPILDPWTTHLGYGGAENCDTIDFGRGTPAPDDTVVIWPYDGQTGLPTTFDGSNEGPEPPEPSSGWPSATPITLYAREATVTEHVLTVDGEMTPIDHVWLTSADSNFLRNAVMMYANAPFQAFTTYRVKIVGTYVGGPLTREWTFTTGEMNRR